MQIYLYLLISFFATSAHDIPLSITTLNWESQSVNVELKFDKEDLEQVIGLEKDLASSSKIKQYIQSHTQFQVNGKQLKLSIASVENDEEHYIVKALLENPPADAKTMQIQNTCLVKEINNHSNIIYLNYEDQRRGFRLHKDRPSTSFEF